MLEVRSQHGPRIIVSIAVQNLGLLDHQFLAATNTVWQDVTEGSQGHFRVDLKRGSTSALRSSLLSQKDFMDLRLRSQRYPPPDDTFLSWAMPMQSWPSGRGHDHVEEKVRR